MFSLHPTLAKDCFVLGHFPLCELLMMNDSQYPWFILVPQRENIKETYELSVADQHQLNKESCHLGKLLAAEFNADKMNIAALGNVVPQLHIHHIVRYKTDPAWPTPVWGRLPATPYSNERKYINRILSLLGSALDFVPLNS
ncbi:MAG: HIT domain-containing protein [Pseudomonadales bacterium]|nr:HIT domain-containing protein [Pseudomonadales bacterium]